MSNKRAGRKRQTPDDAPSSEPKPSKTQKKNAGRREREKADSEREDSFKARVARDAEYVTLGYDAKDGPRSKAAMIGKAEASQEFDLATEAPPPAGYTVPKGANPMLPRLVDHGFHVVCRKKVRCVGCHVPKTVC